MALFKISKGLKANLPSVKTAGYCWYTTDDSLFYIDYEDENGTIQRKPLNAKDAETLTGASLNTILSSSDIEIPTSKAVLDALSTKANMSDLPIIKDSSAGTINLTWDGEIGDKDSFQFGTWTYCKQSSIVPEYSSITGGSTFRSNGMQNTNATEGVNCYAFGDAIVVTSAGTCSKGGTQFEAPSTGIYFGRMSSWYTEELEIDCNISYTSLFTTDVNGTQHVIAIDENNLLSVTDTSNDSTVYMATTSYVDGKLNETVNPDWNELDPDSKAYILNKPFYEIPTEKVIISNKQRTMSETSGTSINSYYINYNNSIIAASTYSFIVEGQQCKLSYTLNNGSTVKITGNAKHYSATSGYKYEYYVFGNQYLLNGLTSPSVATNLGSNINSGENTAVIFVLAYYNGTLQTPNCCIYVVTTDIGMQTASLVLSVVDSDVVQLNEKYIPDTIARTTDLDNKQDIITGTAGQVVGFDENGDLVATDAIQSDWNQNDSTSADYVKNRTHYMETKTITWDGDATDLVGVEDMFFLVSSEVFTDAELQNGVVTTHGSEEQYNISDFWDKANTVVSDDIVFVSCGLVCVRKAGADINLGSTVAFPEVGVYFMKNGSAYLTSFTTEVAVQLDQKYIPDTIARVYDIVQSDWNQNDETAPDYVKNRTHWEDSAPIITEQTVIVEPYTLITIDTDAQFVDGNSYKVMFNDETFVLTAQLLNEADYSNPTILGNASILSSKYDDTGYDFVFLYNFSGSNSSVRLLTKDTGITSHTFSINEIVVHYLDRKYIKDMYGETDPIETVLVDNASVTIANAGEPAFNPFSIEFVEGETYTVTWNGTTYECPVYIEQGALYIGNGLIGGASYGNGEPFVIAVNTANNVGVMVFASEAGTHTVSIVEMESEIIKIPEKYLPDVINSNIVNGTGEGAVKTIGAAKASGRNSLASGTNTTASGDSSHAEGNWTTASGRCSHAEGGNTTASGSYSHTEGDNTEAYGYGSHAENKGTNAYGSYSHAEGYYASAYGDVAHAEGRDTIAYGYGSHAEGVSTFAFGENAHAEGGGTYTYIDITGDANSTTYVLNSSNKNIRIGNMIESYDNGTIFAKIIAYNPTTLTIEVDRTLKANASLNNGKVKMFYAGIASGNDSHTEGYLTIAASDYQHAQGKYNIEDANNIYAHIVGNGYYDNSVYQEVYSNAHTLDWDGNAWFAGDVYVGSTSGTNKDEGSKKLVTVEEMNAAIAAAIEAAFANIANAEEVSF